MAEHPFLIDCSGLVRFEFSKNLWFGRFLGPKIARSSDTKLAQVLLKLKQNQIFSLETLYKTYLLLTWSLIAILFYFSPHT